MMKQILSFALLLLLLFPVVAQKAPYDEKIDAMAQIDSALSLAQREHKYVVCQVGGNWCKWCILFNQFIHEDADIRKLIDDNFVYIHVNYSKSNKNLPAMERLGFPQRFGYPVLVFLNREGGLVHIQETGLLENDNGYDAEKVKRVFANWTEKAVSGAGLKQN